MGRSGASRIDRALPGATTLTEGTHDTMEGVVWTAIIYLTQLLAGVVVLRVVGAGEVGWPGRVAAVLLLGPGAIALQMLIYTALGVAFGVVPVLALWWVVCAWMWWQRPGRVDVAAPAPAAALATSGGVGHGVTAALAVGTVLIAYAVRAPLPVHDFDTINNFAVLGKLYAAHGGIPPAGTLVDPGHIDYPPLVAFNEALLFLADADRAPWTVRPLFAMAHLALALLALEVLWLRSAPWRSGCAALLVLAAPEVLDKVGGGVADGRLTATVLLVALQGSQLACGSPGAVGRLVVAAGLCALTKNEGVAVAVGVLLVLLVYVIRDRSLLRRLPVLLGGRRSWRPGPCGPPRMACTTR